MSKIRIQGMLNLLTEKYLRSPFHMIQRMAEFKVKKEALLEKMPLPRRKKWWEKLSEHQYDHFYEEAEEILPSVPRKYLPLYQLVIDQKLMNSILVI